ncbi:MAG: GNAT family N-acetyltransferase [Chloroflexi bacterium]|nr:GNAT family N-acetyltransferase [Chloroflexota bacterium]
MDEKMEAGIIQIRPARRDDAHKIASMVKDARLNPLGIRWERFRVAMDSREEVIGCAQVKDHRDGSMELASLVVRAKWRGHGVGRALVKALQIEHGPPLWLTSRSSLVPYYQRFGFRELEAGVHKPAYFRWVSRLVNTVGTIASKDEYLAVMLWDGKN